MYDYHINYLLAGKKSNHKKVLTGFIGEPRNPLTALLPHTRQTHTSKVKI